MTKTVQHALVLAALLSFSGTASAQWVAGVGYVDLSEDIFDDNLRLGGIYGSIGYEWELESNVKIVPELRVATGVADDFLQAFGTDFELDYFVAFGVRAQYEFDSGFYAYAVPSYGRVKLTADFGPSQITEGESEFGFGAGAGYRFSDKVAAEISLEDFDGTDALSLGFRFAF